MCPLMLTTKGEKIQNSQLEKFANAHFKTEASDCQNVCGTLKKCSTFPLIQVKACIPNAKERKGQRQ